ncbi:MAG: hypothetical protein NTX86_01470 [Candidatus Dependentiae bacterium]|nr:hypothetical protein [Candidatus Dependentiae bacterium]
MHIASKVLSNGILPSSGGHVLLSRLCAEYASVDFSSVADQLEKQANEYQQSK